MSEKTSDPPLAPDHIGPYQLLELLGEGGMGEVWLAEQNEPVHRRVALKIIKPGMDTRQVIARFQIERQSLAIMDHPSIAKVHDAGVTARGRPYFVMELVEGESLNRYCDNHRLRTRERALLFTQVCRAVQHAHQKGVIHRDLKPGNILVTEVDGRPLCKVIDFGIARAIGSQEETRLTRVGHAVGTPAYMAPEQLDPTAFDVDTRADVYSLGAVLYELVTGALPFEEGSYRGPALYGLSRRNTPAPSERLSSLSDSQSLIAEMRGTDPGGLRKQLTGDLDWIVLKAMEPDRERRYETANGLAVDLERHLRHEPVVARPPSVRYRVGRFVRRNRTATALSTALLLLLMAFAGAMTVQAQRIADQRDRAEQETTTAQRVSDFMVELFRVSDPDGVSGSVTAREILDRGARRIEEDLAEEPEVQGGLLLTLGDVYLNLGLVEESVRMFERAVDINMATHGPNSVQAANSLYGLADALSDLGRYEEAASSMVRALEIMERELGPDHPGSARIVNGLASIYRDLGQFEEALPLFERSLEDKEATLGPNHLDVATTLSNLATLHRRMGNLQRAEQLYSRALEIRESELGPQHPAVARTLNSMAILYFRLDDLARARETFSRALEIKEATLGPDHPDVANSLNNLANVELELENYVEARALYHRALMIREASFGPQHASVGEALGNLASVERRLGNYDEAERLYLRSIPLHEASVGPDHPAVANVLNSLGYLLTETGRYAEAETHLRRALEIHWTAAPRHPNTATALGNLVELLRKTGRDVEADSLEARLEGARREGEGE